MADAAPTFRRAVLMPSIEVGMEQGLLVELLVEPGVTVSVGDPLFTVEAEKVTLEIESPVAGRIVALLADPGSELAVGAEVLVIEVAQRTSGGANP
jgi:2-oxoisovalerate dehydrogenase E2 component (dihydrolipoyl transacylase)